MLQVAKGESLTAAQTGLKQEHVNVGMNGAASGSGNSGQVLAGARAPPSSQVRFSGTGSSGGGRQVLAAVPPSTQCPTPALSAPRSQGAGAAGKGKGAKGATAKGKAPSPAAPGPLHTFFKHKPSPTSTAGAKPVSGRVSGGSGATGVGHGATGAGFTGQGGAGMKGAGKGGAGRGRLSGARAVETISLLEESQDAIELGPTLQAPGLLPPSGSAQAAEARRVGGVSFSGVGGADGGSAREARELDRGDKVMADGQDCSVGEGEEGGQDVLQEVENPSKRLKAAHDV